MLPEVKKSKEDLIKQVYEFMKTKTRIAAVIVKNGKLLMEKGRGCKELWMPGGKIKEGESDQECLKRELKEELKAEITSMKFFKEYLGKSFYNDWMNKQKVYIVSIVGEIQPGAEIEDYVWLSREDFENKKHAMIPITEKEITPDLIKNRLF